MSIQLLHGDCRERLKTLQAESVNCCVTSPPYFGLRDYGLDPMVWTGDTACEHEWGKQERGKRGDLLPREESSSQSRMGTDDRQGIGPMDGGRFCGRCNAWRGSLGLEPTPQLYVEHMVEVFREVRRVLRDDGTLWLNLGDSFCSTAPGTMGDGLHRRGILTGVSERRAEAARKFRPETPTGLKPKDLVGIPWMVAFALRDDGWYLRSEIIWAKPNPMPESVTDRPTKSHEQIFLLAKSERYFFNQEAVREPQAEGTFERFGTNGRRTGSGPKQTGSPNGLIRDKATCAAAILPNGRNIRSVWTIATQPFSEWQRSVQADRVPVDAGGDGILRITSLDCREHVGRPDLVPSRFCGEREVSELSRSLGTDVHPAQALVADSERSAMRRAYCSEVESRDCFLLDSALTATHHSNGTSKTGHVPATTSPCSASAGTRSNTDGSEGEPDSFDSAERTPESSSAEDSEADALAIARDQIGRRNAGKCTCLYYRITMRGMSHFATFPEELAKRCILAGTPEGGVVLDPFAGSGTVGQVAESLQCNAILIEAQAAYIPLIEQRCVQGSLLATANARAEKRF